MSTNNNFYQNKKTLPTELRAFNWGAFLLTFVWGIKFKAWWTLLVIPLIWFQLPLGFNWILFGALQIFFGFKGNEWAYQVDWWKKPKDFQATQIKWAMAGVAINIIVPLIILGIGLRFVQKSPDNVSNFIENTQCAISYNKIQKGLPEITQLTSSSSGELAKQFAAQYKDTKLDGTTVIFSIKDGSKSYQLYGITFSKLGYNTPCDLKLENCIITSSYVVPQGLFETRECTFFFDTQGNVKPNTQTQKAVEMGYNIFKYL